MILGSFWGHCGGYSRGPELGMEACSGAAGCRPCGSLLSSSAVLSSYVTPAWLPPSPLLFSQTKDDYGKTACTQQAGSANQQMPKATAAATAAAAAAAAAAAWLGPTGPQSPLHTHHWHRALFAVPPRDISTSDLGAQTSILWSPCPTQGCSNVANSSILVIPPIPHNSQSSIHQSAPLTPTMCRAMGTGPASKEVQERETDI